MKVSYIFMLLLGLATQILSKKTDITLNLTEPIDTKIGFSVTTTSDSVFTSTFVGDVNGDGADDLAIPDSDTIYIIYGKAGGPSSSYSISDIESDPTKGFIIWTDNDYSLGRSVSSAGDFNKDGLGDILVGAPDYGESLGGDKGAAFIIYGRQGNNAGSLNVDWIEPNGTTLGVRIEGKPDDDLGYSVSYAGDVNGDQVDDIIVGTNEDKVYIIYGKRGGMNHFSVADLDDDTTLGYEVNNDGGEDFGRRLSYAGDVNGDGIADLLIGSPYYNDGDGAATVLYGARGTATQAMTVSNDLDITKGFRILGSNYMGDIMSTGDVNKDGISDVILGSEGSVCVIYGKKDGGISTVNTSEITSTQGFKIYGPGEDYFGYFISSADFNGDWISDIVIGAPNNNTVYVIFGKEGGLADVNVTSRIVDNTTGIKIIGTSENQNFGLPVSSTGDFNKDGGKDILIGAVQMTEGGNGTLYVFYGEPVPVNDDDDGLSGGQIAGIVIGSVAAVAIVLGAVLTYKKWPCRKANRTAKKFAEVPQASPVTTNPTNAV